MGDARTAEIAEDAAPPSPGERGDAMTKREAEAIQEAIEETVRHVFYAMTDLKLDPKTGKAKLEAQDIETLKSEVNSAVTSALQPVISDEK